MAKQDMIHASEALRLLGVDENGLQNLVARGEIRAYRHAGSMAFRRRELEKFKREQAPAADNGLVNVAEAMRILNISDIEVQGLVTRGDIRAFRSGDSMAFRRADVEKLKREQAADHGALHSNIDSLTFLEAKQELKLTEEQLQKLVGDGELRAYRKGYQMVFRRADLAALKDRPPQPATPLIILNDFDMAFLDDDAEGAEYDFEAMDGAGKTLVGLVRARSPAAVEAKLRARNYVPTKITVAPARKPVAHKQCFHYVAANYKNVEESGIIQALDEDDAELMLMDRGRTVLEITRVAPGVAVPHSSKRDSRTTFTQRARETLWLGAGFMSLGILLLIAAGMSGDSDSLLPLWVSLGAAGVFTLLASVPLLLWRYGITFGHNPKSATIWLGPGFPLFKQTKELGEFAAVRVEDDPDIPGIQYRLRFTGANDAVLDIPLPQAELAAAMACAENVANTLRLEFKADKAPAPEIAAADAPPLAVSPADEPRERELSKQKDGAQN